MVQLADIESSSAAAAFADPMLWACPDDDDEASSPSPSTGVPGADGASLATTVDDERDSSVGRRSFRPQTFRSEDDVTLSALIAAASQGVFLGDAQGDSSPGGLAVEQQVLPSDERQHVAVAVGSSVTCPLGRRPFAGIACSVAAPVGERDAFVHKA
mmetsp:Transcript_61340/g.154847  ORF Transcript_61340/g.154847 Transcript_61340/m.154847 type:complete len:157 (-) Transcript_61340:337-807(-)|eukprot:CAMPEP_0115181444 /NCGR_PEP_ID=MMETSP0270-20121206/7433_1 /TAXON_ID=71861 /ORGANISM="Scrippsiella trochoidea, Strain CCMP3099" /LENGTH=156 /DNA_ID=CAMNT_0002594465 /DNA_START=71 /DNA_END=541 /DNA_ORIENTATION=-